MTAIGDRVQPILFTHHRHVVDIARGTIGSELAVIDDEMTTNLDTSIEVSCSRCEDNLAGTRLTCQNR